MKFFWVISIAVFLFACKSDSNQAESTANPTKETSTPAVTNKPYQAYIVNVDQLRIRDAPGSKSKIIGNLPEYEVVYARGEVSELIDSIVLRNEEYISPYHKIISSEGAGWMFGGAMTKIYEGNNDIKAPATVSTLAKDLRKVKKNNISVGGWMANRITNEDMTDPIVNDMYLAVAMDALNDGDFLYNHTIEKALEDAEFTNDDYRAIFDRTFDPASNPFSKKAYDSGFVMNAGEGMFWPELSLTRFMEIIGGPFTESMKAYAEVDKFIYDNPYMSDAAIYTKKDVIAQVIDKVVNYQSQYPNNLYKERNQEMIGWMINDIKFGSANTPAFDYDTDVIDPEWKSELFAIIKKYKGSTWISELEQFRDEMEKKSWKMPQPEY